MRLTYIKFCLLIALIFTLLNFIFFNVIFTKTSDLILIVSVVFIVFCIELFIVNLVAFPFIAKPILIFLIIISSICLYFINTFQVVINSDMVQNVFETTLSESKDLITVKYLLYVIMFGILPSIIIYFIEIDYTSYIKHKIIVAFLSVSTIVLVSFASYQKIASFGRNNQHAQRLIVPSNFIYGTVRYLQSLQKQEFIRFDEISQHVPYEDSLFTVLVLIVGETSRSANWQLSGYNKETNPLLSKQDIVYFKNTISCGTSTATSVPCMFSNLTRANFDGTKAKNSENALDLIARHWEIVWFDNDGGSKNVANRIEYVDVFAENDKNFCGSEYCIDGVLIKKLQEKLKNINKDTLIVLHTIGSHGPSYYKRYPEEFAKFTPSCNTKDIATCSQAEITNVYDNTILYTDFIINSAIEEVKNSKYEAGVLYVSDHGESLGENGIYLHGIPYSIAPKQQKEIPFLFFANENMKTFDYLNYECLKNKAENAEFSHDFIFHSLIAIAEIKTEVYDKNLDIFNGCRTKELFSS